MAVPKRKHQYQKRMRRSHHKLISANVVEGKKAVNINYHITLILNLDIITGKNSRYLIIINDKKITIAIDAMGGENSPDKTVEGVSYFIREWRLKQDLI